MQMWPSEGEKNESKIEWKTFRFHHSSKEFWAADGESSHQSPPSKKSCIFQEQACHYPWWTQSLAGLTRGKCGFIVNVVSNFRQLQLEPLVNYALHSQRSKRYIFVATRDSLIAPHTHTSPHNLEKDSSMIPIILYSWEETQKLENNETNYSPHNCSWSQGYNCTHSLPWFFLNSPHL